MKCVKNAISNCLTTYAGPLVTVGLVQETYTVHEGHTVRICAQMTSGEISKPLVVTIEASFSPALIRSKCMHACADSVHFILLWVLGAKATDGLDLAALHEQLTFLPSRPDELQCVDVTAFNDTIYESTEARAIFLRNNDVKLEPASTILEILDHNS